MIDANAQRHKRTWHVWELVKAVGMTGVWGVECGRWQEESHEGQVWEEAVKGSMG